MTQVKIRVKDGHHHGRKEGSRRRTYHGGEVFKGTEKELAAFSDKLERAGNRAVVSASTPGTAGGAASKKKAAAKKVAAQAGTGGSQAGEGEGNGDGQGGPENPGSGDDSGAGEESENGPGSEED